jgi:hypothetical protein
MWDVWWEKWPVLPRFPCLYLFNQNTHSSSIFSGAVNNEKRRAYIIKDSVSRNPQKKISFIRTFAT